MHTTKTCDIVMHTYIYMYLCSVPVEPEWQALPELEVDERVVSQWWQVVEQAAKSRPGLETVVVSAVITAMHHLDCEYNSSVKEKACCLFLFLTTTILSWYIYLCTYSHMHICTCIHKTAYCL